MNDSCQIAQEALIMPEPWMRFRWRSALVTGSMPLELLGMAAWLADWHGADLTGSPGLGMVLAAIMLSAIVSGLVESTLWLRLVRAVLLAVTIAVYWLMTDYPWDDLCMAYVWLNLFLGLLRVSRVILWPEFLWAITLAALLAYGNWRVF